MNLLLVKNYLSAGFNKFLKKEDGEVNIVAIVILIAIAVGLALLFKERVAKIINDIFDGIKTDNLSTKPASTK